MSAKRSLSFDNLLSRREFVKDLGLAGTFALLALTGGCEQTSRSLRTAQRARTSTTSGPAIRWLWPTKQQ